MIKPILSIELSNGTTREALDEITKLLEDSDIKKEYHLILWVGNSEYVRIEIITASDINLHLPK